MSNQLRLLFFIVVISGALCTVEDYVIMSQCAHNKAIHVAAEGTVSVTDISQTQNITIVGLPDYVNNNFKIALYAKETQRYVCFNENWKLVGMKELRDTCYFNETIVHGYFVFRSAVDLQRRVGFTHRGKAVGPKKNVNDACYMFTKIQADQFFHQHTDYFAPKPRATATSPATAATLSSASAPASSPPSSRLAPTTAANRSKLPRNKNKRINAVRNNSNHNNHNSNNNQNQQQYTNGHSSNISASNSNRSSSSNTSLSNAKQQLGLSPAKYHNSSSNHTREHVRQQQHLVRHHHNDPNVVARRQQHEHKQKRRQRNRLRGATSLTATTTTTVRATTATAPTARARKPQTPATFYSSTAQVSPLSKTTTTTTTAKAAATQSKTFTTTATTQTAFGATAAATASRYKQHSPAASNAADRSMATSVAAAAAAKVKSLTTTATTTNTTNKRKGRRRKGRKHLPQRQRNKLLKAEQQLLPLKSQLHIARSSVATSTLAAILAAESTYASSTTFDDVAVSSSSSSSSVAADYPYDSSEWLSSAEPFESSPASPTAPTFAATSLSSAAEADVAASSSPTTANDTSLEATDADFTSEVAATATTIGSNMLRQPATTHANSIISEPEQQQLYGTSAAYALPDTWSPATFYDELETTVNGEPLLAPTPTLAQSVGNALDVGYTQAAAESPTTYGTKVNWQSSVADEYATTTSNSNDTVTDFDTDNDNDTDSSNSAADFASEATEPMESVADDTTGTAETTFAASDVAGDDIVASGSENLISVSSKAATTVATFLRNKLQTSEQEQNEYSNNLKATATVTAATHAVADSSTIWSTFASSSSSANAGNLAANDLTEFIYSTRSSNFHKNSRHSNVSNNKNNNSSNNGEEEQPRQVTSDTSNNFSKKYLGEGNAGGPLNAKLNRHANKMHSSNMLPTATTATATATVQHIRSTATATSTAAATTPTTRPTTTNTAKTAMVSGMHRYSSDVAGNTNSNQSNLLSVNKNINHSHNNNTILESHFDSGGNKQQLLHTPTTTATATATATVARTATTAATSTTKKSIRISTQRLLATPFHQLTYVRNGAGDIDIDNIDNISVYPDLLEEQALAEAAADTNHADVVNANANSRLTMVSGYLPTSATAVLPESIRIAKIKINKERRRMMTLRQRHFGSHT